MSDLEHVLPAEPLPALPDETDGAALALDEVVPGITPTVTLPQKADTQPARDVARPVPDRAGRPGPVPTGVAVPPLRAEHPTVVARPPDPVWLPDAAAPLDDVAARSAGPTFDAGVRTSPGRRRRVNEDAVLVRPDLLGVADGVGGGPAGDVAARRALSAVADHLDGELHHEQVLSAAARHAHRVVRAEGRRDPALRGMACTLDLVGLWTGAAGDILLTGVHVGDGAVWHLPREGDPYLVTSAHTDGAGRLLRMVGHTSVVHLDGWSRPVSLGDRVVLASDGLWCDLGPYAVMDLIRALCPLPPQDQADLLVEAALRAGGTDNVSVVVGEVTAPASLARPDGARAAVQRAIEAPPGIVLRDARPGESTAPPAVVRIVPEAAETL